RDSDTLWNLLSPTTQATVRSPENFKKFVDNLQTEYGREMKVLDEKTDNGAGMKRYVRTAGFEKKNEPYQVPWNFDAVGKITTVGIRKRPVEAESPYLQYHTKTTLRLPFDGEWIVWWGGRTTWENFHAGSTDQRFATDFVVVKDGRTFSGSGAKNEDYFAFGQP